MSLTTDGAHPDPEGFALATLDLDRTSVAREDGQVVIERQLAEEGTDTEDVAQLAFEHGLEYRGGAVDLDRQVVRERYGGEA